jgi:hypothetical protein
MCRTLENRINSQPAFHYAFQTVYPRHSHYIHGFKSLRLLLRILYLDFRLKTVINETRLHVPNMNTHEFCTKHFYALTITNMGVWRYT